MSLEATIAIVIIIIIIIAALISLGITFVVKSIRISAGKEFTKQQFYLTFFLCLVICGIITGFICA